MKTEHKFYEEINLIKGFAAVLVVLGHALMQTGVPNVFFNGIYSVLYSFHMQIFFFAAGFVSIKMLQLEGIEGRAKYIGSRCQRLLVPYFVMGIIYTPLKIVLQKYANLPYDFSTGWRIFIGENPDGALWFLYALFIISLCVVLVIQKSNVWILWGISLVVMIISCMFTYENVIVREILFNAFFFMSGLICRIYYEKVRPLVEKKWVALVVTIGFVVGNYFYFFDSANYLWKILTGICGTIWFLCIGLWITETFNKQSIVRKTVSMLGDYSMDIYIFAEPIKVGVKILFWSLLKWNYMICTMLCFVLPIIFAIVGSRYVVRRISFFKKIFLGYFS